MDFWSVSLAQKPKSASQNVNRKFRVRKVRQRRTDFNVALSIKEDIVRFDIAMDDALAV